MTITGIHHITLVCENAQRTIDFYTKVLGMRLVKLTVNFDDPGSYHLYFGDQQGHPGTIVTFFEWSHAQRGSPGIGGTHHLAWSVPGLDDLVAWKSRLEEASVPYQETNLHGFSPAIHFHDPDGALIEIATNGQSNGKGRLNGRDGMSPKTAEGHPVIGLGQAIHHLTVISSDLRRSHDFYGGLLNLNRLEAKASSGELPGPQSYWGAQGSEPFLNLVERKPAEERRARIGIGQTHHFAMAVPDEQAQLAWREKLLSAGLQVTPVLDRVYFKSIYMRDPDGHIVELATAGPGFAVDEPESSLGSRLMLPPWLEASRAEIQAELRGITP